MLENYPPGAANDPQAPYNEKPEPEIEVTVRATLIKETVVLGSGTHTCTECETEPDGSRSYISFEESDDDPAALFRDQGKTPIQIIMDCQRIVKELLKEKKRSYADIYLPCLLDACDGWEEEEVVVKE